MMTQFEYFRRSLPEWDGKNRVAELESKIKATITFHKTCKALEHINIMRMLKECCGDNSNRVLFLTFSGKQGIGKSIFARWLFPFSYLFAKSALPYQDWTGMIANEVIIVEKEELPKNMFSPYINDIVCEITEIDYSYINIDIKQLYAQIVK